MILVILIPILLCMISFGLINPGRYEDNYEKLLKKECPLLYYLIYIFIIIIILYIGILAQDDMQIYWVDEYINPYTILACLLFTFIYKKLICSLINKEINSVSNLLLKEKPNLKNKVLFFIYSTSVCFSIITIHSTNCSLDYSIGQEKIVTISKSIKEIVNSKTSKEHCTLYFEPPVYGLNVLVVPSYIQEEAKPGNKLSIKIFQGLYGTRYIGRDLKVIK